MNVFDLSLLAPLLLECVDTGLGFHDLIFGNTHFAQCCRRIGFCLCLRFREFLAEFVAGTHETVFLSDAYECHVELLQHVLGDVLLQIYTNLRQQASRLVVRIFMLPCKQKTASIREPFV